ncbi:MAG: hypothetical protein IPF47_18085 [Gemmatimonadetes bacterium]|nr:hypothetical protein [Gemmatimonadota bacterium]
MQGDATFEHVAQDIDGALQPVPVRHRERRALHGHGVEARHVDAPFGKEPQLLPQALHLLGRVGLLVGEVRLRLRQRPCHRGAKLADRTSQALQRHLDTRIRRHTDRTPH